MSAEPEGSGQGQRLLLTGGLGYIGSHTTVELLQRGYDVVIFDNLYNSNLEVLNRIETITSKRPAFVNGDVRKPEDLAQVFSSQRIDAVIHFAGLKAVGESSTIPLDYYDNNVNGTLVLLRTMLAHQVHRIIFSSSATVYGDAPCPIRETTPLGEVSNPYGRTKLMCEGILTDLWKSKQEMSVGILRYFNPIGAHSSGLMGEDPNGIPNNLVPYISQVAVGRRPHLTIFGDDWPTPDGTCLRDFIHVVDLARGHVAMVDKALRETGYFVYNLGTGSAVSVKEMVAAFDQNLDLIGSQIKTIIGPRRDGDICTCYADTSKAAEELGWKAIFGLSEMVRDTLVWQKRNPDGFKGALLSLEDVTNTQ